MRAGAGFGVALHGEHGAVGELDTLQRAVEQRAVGYFGVGGQRVGVHFETVVLAGNHHFATVQILHRVVGAVVAEGHFAGFAAEGEAEQLVSQADAEHGLAAVNQFSHRGDGVIAGLGVAGAVGEEDAVGVHTEHVLRRGLRGHHGQPAAACGEHAQDIGFHAEIVGHNVIGLFGGGNEALAELPFAFRPFVAFSTADFFGQIFAHHAAEGGNQLPGFFHGGVCAGEDGAGLGAFVAQDTGEAAGVDVGDGNGLVAHQVVLQAFDGAEVAVQERQVADNQAGGIHAAAFCVFVVGAGVADVRVGEGNDLFAVGGVGENFLIAGHGSVEHDFAGSRSFITD